VVSVHHPAFAAADVTFNRLVEVRFVDDGRHAVLLIGDAVAHAHVVIVDDFNAVLVVGTVERVGIQEPLQI
jgi:hypothetical protein